MSKVEPSAVSLASRQLDVTRVYAEDLLSSYHLKGQDEKRISDLAHELVWGFPDHAYVIWRDGARKLGLNVVDAEADPLWESMSQAHEAMGGDGGCEPGLFKLADFQGKFPSRPVNTTATGI